MKKVELHVHFDGSIRVESISKILGLPLDKVKEHMVVSDKVQNLDNYLGLFKFPLALMQNEKYLKKFARELAVDLIADDVIYAEVRFAPLKHTRGGLSINEVIETVLDGFKKVKNIKINLILCMMRESSIEDNLKIVRAAKKYRHQGVVALDLAGNESLGSLRNYKILFEKAKEWKIPFTIHAGEVTDAQCVKEAIMIGAQRIGHGIKAIEDEETIKLLKEKKVILELCPTSNVDTRAINKYKNHPIKDFLRKGVLITINTDNRTVSNITLEKEYAKLSEVFGFGRTEFRVLNLLAIKYSFLSVEEKLSLMKKMSDRYDNGEIKKQ